MTATLLCLALGGLAFDAQELSGLQLELGWNMTRRPTEGFQRGDFDGDGKQDLIVAGHVIFQRDGKYSAEEYAAIPEVSSPAKYDLRRDALYYRYPTRLEVWWLPPCLWHWPRSCCRVPLAARGAPGWPQR